MGMGGWVSNELSKGQRLLGQVEHLLEIESSQGSSWEVEILVRRVRGWLSQRVGRFEDCPQQCSAIKVWSRGGTHSGDHGESGVWKKSECAGQLRGGSQGSLVLGTSTLQEAAGISRC